MWVATRPPPGTWPLPSTIRSSPDDLDLDAVDAQHGGGGLQPVGFLDPQFLQAAHDGGALGKGGRHRQHQIFVDHRGRALRRHLDAAQFRGADPELGHRLAGIAANLAFLDRGAHFAQRREQPGAQRIGHDVRQNEVGTLDRSGPPRSGTPPMTDRPAPRHRRRGVPAGRSARSCGHGGPSGVETICARSASASVRYGRGSPRSRSRW